jgi:hypothetical protein
MEYEDIMGMIKYPFKPGQCPKAEPKTTYYGNYEEHLCPCGGVTRVCKNCGGDYHHMIDQAEKCYLKK